VSTCPIVWDGVPVVAANRSGRSWTLTTIYGFSGGTNGCLAEATLTLGRDGSLSEQRRNGGGTQLDVPATFYGCGTAFKVTPPASQGGAWTERTIYPLRERQKDGNDGENPIDGVISDPAGNLYGTTSGWRRIAHMPIRTGLWHVLDFTAGNSGHELDRVCLIYRFTGGAVALARSRT